MRRWLVPAALSILWLLAPGPFVAVAQAAPAPYTDWAFDVRRANEASDLGALAKLTEKRPEFARIWFYGQVFDLVTPGIGDPVKDTLRPRLRTIAETLARLDPPDGRPQLYLDWAQTGRLAEIAARGRELQDAWVNAVGADQPMPARLAAAEHPEVAQPIFHMLFFRAELASRRLGGDRERALLIRTARNMAEGFALAVGDVHPWRTLAAYIGEPGGVPLAGQGVVESQIGSGLNAYLIGDLATARAGLDAALATARAARGGSILVALVMNGAAHAAHWLGDYPAERALRVRVLQAVRPLGVPNLVALVADQMVQAHLADKSVDDMIAYTREMREMGEVVLRTGRHLRTLEEAADAITNAARARFTVGDLESAERVLGEGRALLDLLVVDDAISITTPSDRITEVRRARQTAIAELTRLRGQIAERRGRYDLARTAYGQVRDLYGATLGEATPAASTELDLARVALSAGDPDAALGAVDAAETRFTNATPAPLRARAYLMQGHARLVRGEAAKAFANANVGLRGLREAGLAEAERPLRARLHRLAALALDAAGHAAPARARADEALALDPTNPAIAHVAAVARAEAGDIDAARAVIAPLMKAPDPRPLQIIDGCLLARADRAAEAITALRPIVGQLTLPHLRRSQILGRLCLTAAELATGDVRGATQALAPARALVLEYPDPTLTWRVQALDGRIAAARGDWLAAAGAWRQAMDRYADAVSGQPARGATLDVRTLALPSVPDFADALPGALVRSAARDRSNADTHQRAVLRAVDWAARRAAMPAAIARDPALPDADRPARAALARVVALRRVLADEAVITAERVAATETLRQAEGALRKAATALADADRTYADYYSPAPREITVAPGEALLRYWITDDAGHLWVVLPDAAPRYFELPGASKLEGALRSARAAIDEAPDAWPARKRGARDPNAADWQALAAAARVVLPFLGDAGLTKTLAGARIRVAPHGPLLGFPLDALVLEAPRGRADGSPPRFVGAEFDLTFALHPPADADGEPTRDAAIFGPLPASGDCPADGCAAPLDAALVAALDGASRAGGAEATPAALAAALAEARVVWVATPMTGGAFRTATTALGGASLAEGSTRADAVVVLRPDFSGWLPLDAALSRAGVELVIGALDPPAEATARLAAYLGTGTPLRAAIRAVQRDGLTASVDPEAGGPALHHPYYWAQWLVYAEPTDRAALDAAIKPLPAPPPPPVQADPEDTPTAPVDPYGEGGAAPVDPYGE